MERITKIITHNKDKLRLLILTGAGLAAFNCLTRPDFNLLLYLFIYYVWHYEKDSKAKVLTPI